MLDKNDSPPSFNEMPTELSVSEDLPIGHVLTTVKASDPDTPTRITYSLGGEDAQKFNLDPDTGVLSLTDLLDRETKSKHKLYVQASDGIQKAETCLTVLVSPKFCLLVFYERTRMSAHANSSRIILFSKSRRN